MVTRLRPVVALTSLLGALSFMGFFGARADFGMPPFSTVVDEATAIVDATAVDVEERGGVRIEVHHLLRGSKPPAVLRSAWLNCLDDGVDLSRMLKVGQRYVLVLREASLYATATFYEVRQGESDLECNCWDGSAELRHRWMPISEFKRLIGQRAQRQ